MKAYVKPVFLIEEFAPNKVVATCANDQSVKDARCFIGSTTETEKIITSTDGCTNRAKYVADVQTVSHPYGNDKSMVGGKSYTVPSSAVGVLLWCTKNDEYSIAAWSDGGVHVDSSVAVSDKVHHDQKGLHCHVLPVYGSNVALS